MRWLAMLVTAALVVALFPAAVGVVRAEEPMTRTAAIANAAKVTKAARKKESGDKETVAELLAARDAMKEWADDIREHYWKGNRGADKAFASAWNELLTVSAYHGIGVKARYILKKNGIIWNRFLIGLPVGGTWSYRANRDAETWDQLHMYIEQKRPGGELLRQIKVWTYRWDTTYSGIGGENYKKLAKVMHELDRDCVAKKGRKASKGVKAKKLNKEFKRVYYYYVQGLDVDEEKHVRRQSYYLKGKYSYTYCFEVITYLDAVDGDDRVTEWQASGDHYEYDAILKSLVSNPDYKPK